MAIPAADERASTVTKAVSAMYGMIETQAFQSATSASDHVAAVPAFSGAAPARPPAMVLLSATLATATSSPRAASPASVTSFAVRYGQRPVPCVRTGRRGPAP